MSVRVVEMPLVRPFETHMGVVTNRQSLIVSAAGGGVTGYGECVAGLAPLHFSHESIETAWVVLTEYLCPMLLRDVPERAEDYHGQVGKIRGNQMAVASLEMALFDLQAKQEGVALSSMIGGCRSSVEVGISIGIDRNMDRLLRFIETEALARGYTRVKLKIMPGWDVDVVEAVRREFPSVTLTVDANGAYTLSDAGHLLDLDAFDLLYIEQPLQSDDLVDHANLQRRLKTAICLDESISSPHHAHQALELGSCRNINIKPGRVGGYSMSVAIHDMCRDRGLPVWCGGMAETGIGKAHNVALASLPNFKLPNDIAESRRHYASDIVDPPWEADGQGSLRVPQGPGIGVAVSEERIREVVSLERVFTAGEAHRVEKHGEPQPGGTS